MPLTSDRLIYTQITPADRAVYMSWYTNNDVMKYITGKGLSPQDAQARFEKALKANESNPEIGFFAVRNKEDNTFIGIAKFTFLTNTQVEVGYGSLPQFWGKGYASEMLRCLIDHADTIPQLDELIAIINAGNTASKNVAIKQGFQLYDTSHENNTLVEYYKLHLQKTSRL
jgi:RimJ/RimL family protein N-acetyltransferase